MLMNISVHDLLLKYKGYIEEKRLMTTLGIEVFHEFEREGNYVISNFDKTGFGVFYNSVTVYWPTWREYDRLL